MVKIYIYKSRDGWRWRMKRSGRIIAESGEAYTRKDALRRTLCKLVAELACERYEFIFE